MNSKLEYSLRYEKTNKMNKNKYLYIFTIPIWYWDFRRFCFLTIEEDLVLNMNLTEEAIVD